MKKIALTLLGTTLLVGCAHDHAHEDQVDVLPRDNDQQTEEPVPEDNGSIAQFGETIGAPVDEAPAAEPEAEITAEADVQVLSDEANERGGAAAAEPVVETNPEPAPVIEASSATEPVVTSINQTVTYNSPAGAHTMNVVVTLENGVITTASANEPGVTNGVSKGSLGRFQTNLGSVIGKSIVDVKNMGPIGGASLTTTAFQNAL